MCCRVLALASAAFLNEHCFAQFVNDQSPVWVLGIGCLVETSKPVLTPVHALFADVGRDATYLAHAFSTSNPAAPRHTRTADHTDTPTAASTISTLTVAHA